MKNYFPILLLPILIACSEGKKEEQKTPDTAKTIVKSTAKQNKIIKRWGEGKSLGMGFQIARPGGTRISRTEGLHRIAFCVVGFRGNEFSIVSKIAGKS